MSEIASSNIGSLSDVGGMKRSAGTFVFDGKAFFQLKLLPLLIVFMGFVVMSPVLAHFGWRGIFSLFIVVGTSLVFLFSTSLKLKKWFIYLTLIILCTSSITALYWGDFRFVFANIFLIGVLFLLQFSIMQTINKVVDIASILLLMIVIGGVIGFVLAFLGTPSLLDFPNPDGRPNQFFYTTLSNAVMGDIIRPSGIYDEPGALSLYICAIAAMRHLLGKNNKLTWALLVLGFVTLSLAHLIYVFFHFMAERLTKQNVLSFVLIFLIAVSAVFLTGFNSVLEEKLFHRLVVSEETGSIEGDNRSFRMFNAIELMETDSKIIFFGGDPSCRFDGNMCKTLFPPIGENPLTPLFTNGLLVAWPFYLTLLTLFISPVFGRKYFVPFGFGLLLLQRPEMLVVSGVMISTIILMLTILSIKRGIISSNQNISRFTE